MAFNTTQDRALKVSANLGSTVENLVNNIYVARKAEFARKESLFQKTVAENGLSYKAQLEFRKEQLEELKSTPGAVDSGNLADLELSVANLRKLVKFQKIRDDYQANYLKLKSGKASLYDQRDLLRDQLKSTTDEEIRAEIQNELARNASDIQIAEKNTITNRVALAQKDGTVSTLNKTIDMLATKKAKADSAGDTEESSSLDLSLGILRKQLNETKVENVLHDIDLKLNSTSSSAVQRLDLLSQELKKADKKTPVTIDGVDYASTAEFWETERNAYINGNGSGRFQSFFNDLEKEAKQKIDTVSAISKYNMVPQPTLDALQQTYVGLANRAELANSLDKLEYSKVAVLNYGVTQAAKAIGTSTMESLQANTGLAALGTLEQKYGIDLTNQKANLTQDVLQRASQLKSLGQAFNVLKSKGLETPPTTDAPGTKPNEVLNTGMPDPMDRFKDLATAQAEIARAQSVWQQKMAVNDYAGADSAHAWANKIREISGLPTYTLGTPAAPSPVATPTPTNTPIGTSNRQDLMKRIESGDEDAIAEYNASITPRNKREPTKVTVDTSEAAYTKETGKSRESFVSDEYYKKHYNRWASGKNTTT